MGFQRKQQSNGGGGSRVTDGTKPSVSIAALWEREATNGKIPIASGYLNLEPLRAFIQGHPELKGEQSLSVALWDNREKKTKENSPDFGLSVSIKVEKQKSESNRDEEAPF